MRIVLVLGLFYVLTIDSIDIIKYIDRKPTPAEKQCRHPEKPPDNEAGKTTAHIFGM